MADIQEQAAQERKGAANISAINATGPTPALPCIRREERSPRDRLRISKVVRIWWVLVAHLLLCIAIALGMTLLLDNYKALNDAAGKASELGTKRFRLRVSEVTTIISATLVAVRVCVSSWTAVTIWRCAFILMEEGRTTRSQLSNMMAFRIPFSEPKSRQGWVVVSVILLLFPQPFIGPLVTGAVGWSTTTQLVAGSTEVDVGFHGDSLDADLANSLTEILNLTQGYTPDEIDRLDWATLVTNPQFMKALPIKAAGLTSLMWAQVESGGPTESGPYSRALCGQRVAYNISQSGLMPVNSVASALYLPCVLIENISWKQPPKVVKDFSNTTGSQLSIFSSPVLDYPIPGAAILFDPNQNDLNQNASTALQDMYLHGTPNDSIRSPIEFPKATIFSDSLSLLVLLATTGRKCSVEEQENSTIFGLTTILPEGSVWATGDIRCWAYATVNLTAGVVKFEEAEFINSYTLQSNDSKYRKLAPADFKEDSWVDPAIVLLPDIMALVSIANSSQIPTWDNLEGYVETLIQQSYLASWGILRSLDSSLSQLFVSKAEARLLASVSMFRVWGWFIINMFVPLSGIIWYFGTHFGTGREIILDAPITALLTQVHVHGDTEIVQA